MIQRKDKNQIRRIRHERVRKKISGTGSRPRFCVYRSLSNIYVQVIDDASGVTLTQASTLDAAIKPQLENVDKKGAAKLVGKLAAERALEKGIKQVVFDRGGYVYTGRVAALAQAAREAGLDF
ncbi:MAG: 50S ribosomal protein L18 [Christensenellaceae bacterium]|jgi:large subunit ribosomal protein L18|nr:50S ribosomal protein L18 [Christensenellaceae bacterium]